MGVFTKKIQEARIGGGGVYLEEGDHELEIVSWKAIQTRKKETALVVDVRVVSSTNPTHRVGSTRNIYIGELDEMFDQKSKALCVAAMGLDTGRDAEKISAEDWDKVLEASIKAPLFLGKKIRATGVKMLRKAGKEAIKRDPALSDDPDFVKKHQFTRVDYVYHEERRAEILGATTKK